MYVQTGEVISVGFKSILFLFTLAFIFIRWIISQQQKLSDRIARIEGANQKEIEVNQKKEAEETGQTENASGNNEQ